MATIIVLLKKENGLYKNIFGFLNLQDVLELKNFVITNRKDFEKNINKILRRKNSTNYNNFIKYDAKYFDSVVYYAGEPVPFDWLIVDEREFKHLKDVLGFISVDQEINYLHCLIDKEIKNIEISRSRNLSLVAELITKKDK